jgi:hypothetical protein
MTVIYSDNNKKPVMPPWINGRILNVKTCDAHGNDCVLMG